MATKQRRVSWKDEIESKQMRNRIDYLVEQIEKTKKKFIIYVEKLGNTSFFRDGVRKIDFILVHNVTHKKKNKLNTYLDNLKTYGLELEHEEGVMDKNLEFVKIHGPYRLLLETAYVNNIDLMFESMNELPYKPLFNSNWMHTELTRPKVNSELLTRAYESVARQRPTELTAAERIIIIYAILKKIKFGDLSYEFGLDALKNHSYIVTSYPIHDSSHVWTQNGPLSDRQLLAQYWANPRYFYKVQPYDLIQKYYGPEVALYFHFLGYYNKMLIFPAIVGGIVFLYGVMTEMTQQNYRSRAICSSDLRLCPSCHNAKVCKYRMLNSNCAVSQYSYLLDNKGTFIYAILMAFWARYYVESWKRVQSELMYKWNLMTLEMDISMRPNYPIQTKYRRISKVTGEVEPYVPVCRRILFKTLSIISVLALSCILTAAVFGVVLYRVSMRFIIIQLNDVGSDDNILSKNVSTVASFTGSILGFIFMVSFELAYERIAQWLTDFENPRTQAEYDKSYIYKQFILCFLNGYAQLYYISFFRGKFYEHPAADQRLYLMSDICGPSGCISDISMQLVIILFGKSLLKSSLEIGKPLGIMFMKKLKRKANLEVPLLPLWEQSYNDAPLQGYFLMFDYKEVLMQYGYLTLFASAFPLAPVIALFYNTLEVRVDAIKLTKIHRRPIPLRVDGIGAWNGILNILTFIAITTNILLIAFQTHFVPYMIRSFDHDFYKDGFIQNALSEFAVDDFGNLSFEFRKGMEGKSCYYMGQRYPPTHKLKYQLTISHWHEFGMRFLTVIILESFVFGFTGWLAYMMPHASHSIQQRITYREKMARLAKELEHDPNDVVIKFE